VTSGSDRIYRNIPKCQAFSFNLIKKMIIAQARKSPRGAMYAFPSQKWIASQLGYSREWVNKCIKRLTEMGWLEKINRKRVKGQFRSCLYKLGKVFWAILMAKFPKRKECPHRVKSTSHILNPKDKFSVSSPAPPENLDPQKIDWGLNLAMIRKIIAQLS
jgi:DNA-binding transcriptional MocR family regulator